MDAALIDGDLSHSLMGTWYRVGEVFHVFFGEHAVKLVVQYFSLALHVTF